MDKVAASQDGQAAKGATNQDVQAPKEGADLVVDQAAEQVPKGGADLDDQEIDDTGDADNEELKIIEEINEEQNGLGGGDDAGKESNKQGLNPQNDKASNMETTSSHFFAYLVTTAIVVAALYIAYHNKRKIIAFVLEGRKLKGVRRPNSGEYQRLDHKI
ncbi:trans-Golgi network integral membrane protein 2 [Rhinatrema bivittatum]|uniref:trans-Golgi network integral membrane protein 2 n=1 Tax=Rhinatrema bivittatum TaxID=194408 RepID=UPI00112B0AD9|nr:trans-Golgi network integral membrane protein 2 [Rhinatrema bivittatum]